MIRTAAIGILALISAAGLTLAGVGLASRDDLAIPAGFPGRHVAVLGERIRVHQAGAGRDVLLIHGLPGSIEEWEAVMPLLTARYRVTAYDRPGQGYSSAHSDEFTFRRNADIARELIRTLSLGDVIAVGHSYGGGVLLALALRDAPEIRAYLSIAGSSHPSGGAMAFSLLNTLPVVGRGIAACGSSLFGRAMVTEGLREAFRPNESFCTEDRITTRLTIWLQTKTLVSMAREDLAYDEEIKRMLPGYPGIRAPFHLIHGREDRLVPVRDSERLHALIASSQLFVLKDTGHMVQIVHPTAVVQAIDRLAKNN